MTIFNMDEVVYLLDRSFRIIEVGMQPTDEGCSYFGVTLEGEGIGAAHSEYLTHRPFQLSRLPVAFEAIIETLQKQLAHFQSGGGL
jgi:hypothetical protein